MVLQVINEAFSICKVEKIELMYLEDRYCFISKTDEETSLVCLTEHVPENTLEREDGWRAFRIQGLLDFSLIGILSRISSILAENKIGIFAVSTYNTDYIFTKEHDFDHAIRLLNEKGYKIAGEVYS